MSKKVQNAPKFSTFKNAPTIDEVEHIAVQNLEYFPEINIDDDSYEFNSISGEANPRFQQDEKYMLGGIICQYAWSLQRKHQVLKEREAARDQEKELNGAESALLPAMEKTITKIQESIKYWEFQLMIQVEMFERLARISWGEGRGFTADDKYGQGWWATYKEEMSNRKVLSTTSKEESRSRLLAKRA